MTDNKQRSRVLSESRSIANLVLDTYRDKHMPFYRDDVSAIMLNSSSHLSLAEPALPECTSTPLPHAVGDSSPIDPMPPKDSAMPSAEPQEAIARPISVDYLLDVRIPNNLSFFAHYSILRALNFQPIWTVKLH
jgi:hypothetical protein